MTFFAWNRFVVPTIGLCVNICILQNLIFFFKLKVCFVKTALWQLVYNLFFN
jgi:hypothetical protein